MNNTLDKSDIKNVYMSFCSVYKWLGAFTA